MSIIYGHLNSDTNKLFLKKKQDHRQREQTGGCGGERG